MEKRPVENHKEEVPFSHYCQRFTKLNPEEAAERTHAQYDPNAQTFTLDLMGVEYRIHWPEYAIETCGGEKDNPALALTSLPAQTFLLRYLLEGRAAAFHGQFKTFREMPWGELYIQPFTGRCLTRAAFTFGTRLDRFCTAMERMGAKKLAHGDAAYEFTILGNYKMQIIVWQGDEEFPPNSQILYSDNFEKGFAPEDRVVAGDLAITAIKANM